MTQGKITTLAEAMPRKIAKARVLLAMYKCHPLFDQAIYDAAEHVVETAQRAMDKNDVVAMVMAYADLQEIEL